MSASIYLSDEIERTPIENYTTVEIIDTENYVGNDPRINHSVPINSSLSSYY